MKQTDSRSVLVTGAAGFLGREVARAFKAQDFHVEGAGNGSMSAEEQADAKLDRWQEGPITVAGLRQIFERSGPPAIVIHAAGGSSVQAARQAPLHDFTRTVSATAELVETLRVLAPETHLLMVSSAAVYGNDQAGPIREESVRNPISYYGVHKRLAEDVCLTAAHHWGLRLDIIRFFSLYGAGLKKQIFWDLSGRIRSGDTALMLGGTGSETRDFLHVSDAARLLVHTAARAFSGNPRIVNGGTGVATAIRDAVSLMAKACGVNVDIQFNGLQRSGDPIHLVADVHRLRANGFAAGITLAEGLSGYVEWRDRQTTPASAAAKRASEPGATTMSAR